MPLLTLDEIVGWKPATVHHDFYEKVTSLSNHNKERFVSGIAYLFGIAAVLGFILKRKSTQTGVMSSGMFYPLQSYNLPGEYPMFLEFFIYLYDHYAVGANEREKTKDIERIADGGIEFLMEEFDNQNLNRLDLSRVIHKVKELLNNQKSEN